MSAGPDVSRRGWSPGRRFSSGSRAQGPAGSRARGRMRGCSARRLCRGDSLIVGQKPCESARGISFFPVLVRRAEVDAFRSAVAETLRIKAFPLAVLGPFAPYSFAGDA